MQQERSVHIPAGPCALAGILSVPEASHALVLFAHGSGSGRLSPRNQYVARALNQAGIGTLLMDLLTEEEDTVYKTRFNIDLLTERLLLATQWAREQPSTRQLAVGYFGASTGAAAALRAAAASSSAIGAVVSRGGRPDLAEDALPHVRAPTLLIVGGNDKVVLDLNRQAYARLACEKNLVVVPGATHLFEEPGKLEEVARYAMEWFQRYVS
jgi:putative phosphoribosyl transferase